MSSPDPGTRLVLVRHGETVWHADNRYAGGTSDIDLTERGKQQAADLATWAQGRSFDAVIVSPVRRALETARPASQALGLPLEVVDELREVDFGVAEGHTVDELLTLDADMVHRFRADPAAHPFPGAELAGDAAARAHRALRGICAAHPGSLVLVVAHNTLLRLALCALLDVPVERYRQLFPRLDNAAVTEVLVPFDAGHPAALLTLNSPVTGLASGTPGLSDHPRTNPLGTGTPQAARRPGRLDPKEHHDTA